MALLLIQYLAIDNNEICPKAWMINPSRFNILPKTKYTLKNMAKDFDNFPILEKFRQIWSHLSQTKK